MKHPLFALIAIATIGIGQSAFAEIRSLSFKEQAVVARALSAVIPSFVRGESDTTIENCQISNENAEGKIVPSEISCRYTVSGTDDGLIKPIKLELLLDKVVIEKGEVSSAEFKSLSK